MLRIALPPETEATLRQRAAASGEEVSEYAARLLREALVSPTADELLAPFRRQVEASGASDAELDALGEELRVEAWRERHDGSRLES